MRAESVNGSTGLMQWNYSTALQFFARMINGALIDCKCALGISQTSTHGVLVALHLRGADEEAVPMDEALLARDWIAQSVTPADCRQRRYLSFAECCSQLGVDWELSRTNLLAAINTAADYSTDQVAARLAVLRAAELPDDAEPLFDAPRIVPAVDQITFTFEVSE
jgi:hypothetical protein